MRNAAAFQGSAQRALAILARGTFSPRLGFEMGLVNRMVTRDLHA